MARLSIISHSKELILISLEKIACRGGRQSIVQMKASPRVLSNEEVCGTWHLKFRLPSKNFQVSGCVGFVNWTESSSDRSLSCIFTHPVSSLNKTFKGRQVVSKGKKIIHGEVEEKHENKHLQGKFARFMEILPNAVHHSALFCWFRAVPSLFKARNLQCLAIALFQRFSSSSNAILMIYRVWRENKICFPNYPKAKKKKKINLRNAFLSEFFWKLSLENKVRSGN